MLNRDNVIRRLTGLNEQQRSAVALTCASKVLPYFVNAFPDRGNGLITVLEECWRVLVKGNSINVDWGSISEAAQEAVPTSMDEPDAGPAIPAGEAMLNALEATIEPSPEKAFEALMAAYTAVEMSSFLRMYPANCESVDGLEYDVRMKAVHDSAPVVDFKSFLSHLIARAEQGASFAAIREVGEGSPPASNG